MGLNCSIIKDKKNNVISVNSPLNGESSLLYKEARKLTVSDDEALEIWATGHSESFIEQGYGQVKDSNGEPFISDVVDYIETNNISQLSEEEITEIKLLPINDSLELQRELKKSLFTDGIFKPTKNSLASSDFYTAQEKNNILNDISLQFSLKNLYYKLLNTPYFEINTPKTEDIFRTISSTKINSVGKIKEDNPFINEKEVIQELGGIKNRELFDLKLNDKFNYLKDYSDTLFEKLKNYTRVAYKKISDNTLVDSPKQNTETLFNTVLQQDFNNVVESKAVKLLSYSDNLWQNNREDINDLLKGLKESSAEIGLDLENIENYSQEEIKPFLTTLVSTLNNGDIVTLVNAYNNLFKIDTSVKEEVVKIPNKTTVKIEGNQNEYKLFKDFGLLSIGNQMYIRTNALRTTLDEAYNQTGVSKVTDFSDINTKGEVVDLETMEKMVIYKQQISDTVFEDISNIPTIESEFQNQSKKEFNLPEFWSKVIKEKQNNSQKYNDFYSNFEITETGMKLKNTDPISLLKMSPYIKEVEDYFNSNKYSNLPKQIKESNDIIDDNFLRNYYGNYPKALPLYKNIVTKIDDNTIHTLTKENFIRTKEGVYEAVNNNFYVKLNENNEYTKNYSLNEKPELEISLSDYSYLRNNMITQIELNNIYNKKQSQEIDNTLSCN